MTSVMRSYGRQASLTVVDNIGIYHEGLRYLIVVQKFSSTTQSESRITSLKWKAQQKKTLVWGGMYSVLLIYKAINLSSLASFSVWSNHVKRLGVYE